MLEKIEQKIRVYFNFPKYASTLSRFVPSKAQSHCFFITYEKLKFNLQIWNAKKIIVHKGVFGAIRKDDIPNCSKGKINNSLRGGAKVRKSKSEM
jgi:hypothetical protein